MTMKKQCAVCGTTNQSEIVFAWKRHRDNLVFNICRDCRFHDRVNENTVQVVRTDTYSTIVTYKLDVFVREEDLDADWEIAETIHCDTYEECLQTAASKYSSDTHYWERPYPDDWERPY